MEKALVAARGLIQLSLTMGFELSAVQMNQLTNKSCMWGLQWFIVAKVSWNIWKERNVKCKKGNKMTKKLILSRSLSMMHSAFKEAQHRKLHKSLRETEAYLHWESYAMELG